MGAICVQSSYPTTAADSEPRGRRTFAEDIEDPGCSNLGLPFWNFYRDTDEESGVTTGIGISCMRSQQWWLQPAILKPGAIGRD